MLKNKNGVITGAASGIGKATCIDWVKNGARVVLADLDVDSANALSQELNEKFTNSTVVLKTDVSKKEDIIKAINTCIESFGGINLFFSNAGILPPNDTIENQNDDMFIKTMITNTFGAYYAIKYASIAMKKLQERNCSIIVTGSIAAIRADYTPLGYTASKGALLSMIGRSNDELQIEGIRVNAIVPGGVNTDLYQTVARNLYEKGLTMEGYDIKRYPPLEPEQIANIVTFLASDLSCAIKGQTIIADGGMSQSMGSQPYPSKSKPKKSKL